MGDLNVAISSILLTLHLIKCALSKDLTKSRSSRRTVTVGICYVRRSPHDCGYRPHRGSLRASAHFVARDDTPGISINWSI